MLHSTGQHRLDINIANAPIAVPPSRNRSNPGVVGLEILKRFRITTDYAHNRVWLEANPVLLDVPMEKDRLEIGAAPTAYGLSAIYVAPASPTAHFDLKRGDAIVQIDGSFLDGRYILTYPRMGGRPAGMTSHLAFGDGHQLSLTLAEYC